MKSYDGIIGLALADSMGVPVEFQTRDLLKKHPVKGVIGYGTYNMPEGCWSDDTSLTIATMDGITRNAGIIDENAYKNIADNFLNYYLNDAFTPTDEMFDIGGTTRNAILRYSTGTIAPTKCGGNESTNAGNGALMRILPIAYYAYEKKLSNEEIINIVSDIASLTHRLDTCKMGSYIYTQFAKKLLEKESKENAYRYIQSLDYSSFDNQTVEEYKRVLQGNIFDLPEQAISSLGKTLPTLEASLWAFMNSKDYSSAILPAINLGNDTDTVGACTGGLAGIYYGAENINRDWLSKLRKHDYLKNLCNEYDLSIQNSKQKSTEELEK